MTEKRGAGRTHIVDSFDVVNWLCMVRPELDFHMICSRACDVSAESSKKFSDVISDWGELAAQGKKLPFE